ncbi:uncharacterized protein LOC113964123 [Neopelma chrysocephalum]|uniref:uncharacterized protein LOC113964123 n=1 Tax=Neopelma chrysocephalum TaxID=114329 RepID=UPI000FCD198D|nr:uncharacterized protein LOC113964123 [Neopelma chrysocephalum]
MLNSINSRIVNVWFFPLSVRRKSAASREISLLTNNSSMFDFLHPEIALFVMVNCSVVTHSRGGNFLIKGGKIKGKKIPSITRVRTHLEEQSLQYTKQFQFLRLLAPTLRQNPVGAMGRVGDSPLPPVPRSGRLGRRPFPCGGRAVVGEKEAEPVFPSLPRSLGPVPSAPVAPLPSACLWARRPLGLLPPVAPGHTRDKVSRGNWSGSAFRDGSTGG